ncbi:MAG: GGDEF domain-containing protein, partial [Bacillota bacterium]|nr:GGDEF domain-containing protein [Bacillota bacterium]
LTGAENRASWELLNESSQKLRGTFALLDLNDFKIINDTLGHAKGDQLLRELVFNIQSDPYTPLRLFRYGGDEFVLFVPHERDQKEIIKNRIKQMIMDQEITWGSKGYPVTISFGIVYFEGNARDLPVHIKKADERMYVNKYKRKKLKPFALK